MEANKHGNNIQEQEELVKLTLSLPKAEPASSPKPPFEQPSTQQFSGNVPQDLDTREGVKIGPRHSPSPPDNYQQILRQWPSYIPYILRNPNSFVDSVCTAPEYRIPTVPAAGQTLIPETNIQVPENPTIPEDVGRTRSSRARNHPGRTRKNLKSEIITAPCAWATTRRAKIHSLEYLLSHGIDVISGETICSRHCEKKFEIKYDLKEKFTELSSFISENKVGMNHRAPRVWLKPQFRDCILCNKKNCVKPVIDKKKDINWLFLLLGQMLGFCKLSQLKYFCKHNTSHRTGAKDRILFLTYLGLCKQLDPNGPYDVGEV